MKLPLILFSLIIASLYICSGQSNKKLEDFWGLKIGSSFDECEKALKNNGGKQIKKNVIKNESDTKLSDYQFKGGVIVGNDTCEIINLMLIENKLEMFSIIFKSDDVDTINNILYEQIRKQIAEKYFEPRIDEKSYENHLIATETDSVFSYKTLRRRTVWANPTNDKVDYMAELGLHPNLELIEYKNKNGRVPTIVAFMCVHLHGRLWGH